MTKLIVFSGLPASGKTTLAYGLARKTRALYLRIDSIERALRDSTLALHPAEDAGYRAAQAVAEDNLKLGRSVIIDAVNATAVTREWWAETARRHATGFFEATLYVSDLSEHRSRIMSRPDGPVWEDVQQRAFEPHLTANLALDTSRLTLDACLTRLYKAITDQDRKLAKGM